MQHLHPQTVNNPYPLSFEEHVKSFILGWKESHPDQEVWIWPHPQRMSRKLPDGRHDGFKMIMRVSVEMGGWCAGMFRDLHYIMPIEWQNVDAGYDLIKRIAVETGVPLQAVPGPVTALPGPEAGGTGFKPGRANTYNRSPGRAVRISRAARSAMRRGYF